MKPLAIASCTAAALLLSAAAHAAPFTLRLIGETSLPTGTQFNGVEFGGISGLDRASDSSFWAISDDRGGERGTPRFYNVSLNYDVNNFYGITINSQTYMQRPDGTPFPSNARTVDPESIRVAPNGNLYWSSEGNWNANPSALYQPFVREMTTSGEFVREFSTPSMYNYVDNRTTGGRSNKLFEALTVAPNGKLYVANEDALIQDGSITTLSNGSVVRVSALDPKNGSAAAQYAYKLPQIPVDAAPGAPFGPDNGMAELLAISDTEFIVVERAFASGVGNTIRLVHSTIGPDTTDVSSFDSLTGAVYNAMSREVILEMALQYQGLVLDNVEAISWGQTLGNGNRTLVLAVDNNFAGNQSSKFLAFEVQAIPEPQTPALLLLTGLLFAAFRANRKGRSSEAR